MGTQIPLQILYTVKNIRILSEDAPTPIPGENSRRSLKREQQELKLKSRQATVFMDMASNEQCAYS